MADDSLDKQFLGTGWAFPPEFDVSGCRARLVSHEEDIRESLKILLSTTPGERVMQPTYGCGLRVRVFDSINDSTITLILDMIRRSILFFEPRITLESARVDTRDQYEGRLYIILDYTIRTTNSRHNMVYPFYFREGTDLRS